MFNTHDPAALRRALAGVLCTAALTVTGCGALQPQAGNRADAEAPARESSAPAQPEESEPAPEESAPEESAEPESGRTNVKATAPGTRLTFGRRAVVPYRKGTIGVTVTAVEKGDPAELVREYGRRAKGITPYYIRFTVENVDGGDHAHSSGPLLSLVTADGNGTGAVLTGTMPDCERESAPSDFTTAGATFTSCRLAGARTGVRIVGADSPVTTTATSPSSGGADRPARPRATSPRSAPGVASPHGIVRFVAHSQCGCVLTAVDADHRAGG
ncbi:hypothetical protein E1295_02430 [Nonomuraea mesophila]|uniref:Uncharacterized protein n=1 Tax=Nonomuraea mesophila TaxID=2530382 RepID=A0A4R5FYK7_9ACTN|nr:hypothetical protein [Nonomuraea mesophila]TDE59761.1 hypothetical protein E1295_02430 [Nonomuraea mesophila]